MISYMAWRKKYIVAFATSSNKNALVLDGLSRLILVEDDAPDEDVLSAALELLQLWKESCLTHQ